MEITVLNRQRSLRVDRRRLKALLNRLVRELPPCGATELAVCLVSDRRIRGLNRRYRNRDSATDVLSFPGQRGGGPGPEGHLGDILIAVPRADDQARAARHSLGRELDILLIHGYLHLLGYDHDSDGGEMMRLQRRLVRRLIGPGRARSWR